MMWAIIIAIVVWSVWGYFKYLTMPMGDSKFKNFLTILSLGPVVWISKLILPDRM